MLRLKTLLFVPVLALVCAACGGGESAPAGSGGATPPTVSLAANPTSVTSGGSSTLTWSSTNATFCTASGAWSGTKAVSGNESTGALTASSSYSLTCTNSAGSASATATVTVSGTPPPPPGPTVSLAANPTSVASGGSSTLAWSSTNATSCFASGAWSGSKTIPLGSEVRGPLTTTSTFTLSCNGAGGSASHSVIVTVAAAGTIFGLDFPGSAAVATTLRFRFLNPLPIYPATYIWRAFPRQQAGYYTAFFWGNDDGQGNLNTFLWKPGGGADTYYGAHPYPNPPPSGTAHQWEISIEQQDFVNGAVVYDRWYTQALRVWSDANGKHHEFYWDLPNTDSAHQVVHTSPTTWGNTNPPVPALTWGDAPWNPGNEVWSGILRGIQVYSTDLSPTDISKEANLPLSTSAGAASIWYLNLDPTPTDISDKSGQGHNPAWVGSQRPSLFSQ